MTEQLPKELSRAMDLLRAKRLQEARPLLHTFLRQNPDSDTGWFLLSFAVAERQQQIECLQRALSINPKHTHAIDRMARLAPPSSSPPVGGPSPFTTFSFTGAAAEVGEPRSGPPATDPSREPTTAPVWIPPGPDAKPGAKAAPQTERASISTIEIIFIIVIICLALGILGFLVIPRLLPPATQVAPRVGKLAPNFTLNDAATGKAMALDDYQGQPVVVMFWATWCGYCRREMPSLQAVHNRYKDRGLIILAVDVGESAAQAQAFGKDLGITFSLLDDARSEVARLYNISAFPSNVFIAADGRIDHIEVGSMSEAEIETQVKRILE
jgi:peroxiredoxin